MDGIILFADDQVFDTKSNEYQLFCKFKSDSKLSVLPVESIDVLERTLSSISTYRAIILDWNFKRTLDSNDDTNIPDETPYDILRKFPLYSLIYVYSQNVISDTIKDELNKKFCGKIFFEQKSNSQNLDFEYNKIINGIKQFENNNKHMQVPFTWSQAINESVQKIFRELELADSNWIKEIYDTAKNDGAEPSIEVISVFNNLLNDFTLTLLTSVVPFWILVAHARINKRFFSIYCLLSNTDRNGVKFLLVTDRNRET